MDWFVMRHPETGGVGVVPESALDIHRARDWIRVSDAVDEMGKDQLDLAGFPAVDLDAPPDPKAAKARKPASDEEK